MVDEAVKQRLRNTSTPQAFVYTRHAGQGKNN